MRKTVLLIIFAVFIISCNKDEALSKANRNVFSEENSTEFEELLVFINVKNSEGNYLVANSIDSVNIYVNNKKWTRINSEKLDIAKVSKWDEGNMYLSEKKIDYMLIANQDIDEPKYETAGDYAFYLNSLSALRPGEYACFIESFKITFNDNTTKIYYPMMYKTFSVEPNTRSAFVGEFEFTID